MQTWIPTSLTHGIIRRPRILELLQPAITTKLTLVSAPAGYGKTVIATQLAQQSPLPVTWQTIAERDRDVPNLYAHSISALASIVPGINTLPSPGGRTPSELAALIADHLQDAPPLLYILDDLHHLNEASAAEVWLRSFVEILPQHCHLVLLSRTVPDLPYADMVMRRQVLAVGQDDLRFTPAEVYDLASEIPGANLPSSEVRELTSRLEGWAAGIVLALQPLPSELGSIMLDGDGSPDALFEKLASSMLRSQPPALQDFLLASSTLSRLTPELCSSTLALANSSELLREAQLRNMFLSHAPGGLVYHALFRSFLQRQLKVRQPELFVSLHAKAALWFEEIGQIDEAFDHYMAAGLFEQAAIIADRMASSYFVQGKVETLLRWADQLRHSGTRTPNVFYRCSVIYTTRYEYEAANANLDEAERGYAEANDGEGLADVRYQRAVIALQEGQFEDAILLAKQLVQHIPESHKIRGRALRVQGYAHFRLGGAEAAVEYLEKALPLHRTDGDAHALANLLMDLVVAYTRLGRLDSVAACLQEVVALRRSMGTAGELALALNNLGYHYHLRADYQRAKITLDEGLSVAAKVSDRRAESYLLWSLGDLQRDRGSFDEALHHYTKALELLMSSEPSLRTSVLVSTSTLRRWQGELREAISLAEAAVALSDNHNIAQESLVARAALWAACAQCGEIALAIENLEVISATLLEQGNLLKLLQVLALRAHAALLSADSDGTHETLQLAVHLAEEAGSTQPFVAELLHNPALASFVSAHPLKYEKFIRDLNTLRKAQLGPSDGGEPSHSLIARDIFRLRALTLGREILECEGKPIHSSGWRTAAAREVFFFLLFRGPSSREEIGLAFWPDATPKQVRSNVNTAIYYCRRNIGGNIIIHQDGRYEIDSGIEVWCDSRKFEDLVSLARLLPSRDVRTEELWREAVELYQGDFLPTLDAEWVNTQRVALRGLYLETLTGLGECAYARNDLRTALDAYKRAVWVDPYAEYLHRRIMSLYASLNEKKHMLSHYQEMQNLLRDDLGIDPSPETVALADTLVH